MAAKPTLIEINVRGIGKIEFVSGRNKAMDELPPEGREEPWRPACPHCKNIIPRSTKKEETSVTALYCPTCDSMMPSAEVMAAPINEESKAVWNAAHERTLTIEIQSVIPIEKMPQFSYDNQSIYYLVPNRTPGNLPIWKDLIGLLVATRSVAVTEPVRSRVGSAIAHRKIITISRDKKALVMMDLLPPSLVREPNVDAVFETLPSNLDAVVKKAKALQVNTDKEIIKVLG